jgi:hypothetical protein
MFNLFFLFFNFDLTNLEEVKKAFAPENHQWLTKEENSKKVSSDLKQRRIYE